MESVSTSTLATESVPVRERAWLSPLLLVLDSLLIPAASLVASLVIFALFILITGNPPFEVLSEMYRGAFGTWFSFQNTLLRAAPLMLTGLCTALPARLGLIIIGGEGAMVVGGVAAAATGVALTDSSPYVVLGAMMLAAMLMGVLGPTMGASRLANWLRAAWIALAAMRVLRTLR